MLCKLLFFFVKWSPHFGSSLPSFVARHSPHFGSSFFALCSPFFSSSSWFVVKCCTVHQCVTNHLQILKCITFWMGSDFLTYLQKRGRAVFIVLCKKLLLYTKHSAFAIQKSEDNQPEWEITNIKTSETELTASILKKAQKHTKGYAEHVLIKQDRIQNFKEILFFKRLMPAPTIAGRNQPLKICILSCVV